MRIQQEVQGSKIKNVMMTFVQAIMAVVIGLLVYTLFTDGPDLVRGTKSVTTITVVTKIKSYF